MQGMPRKNMMTRYQHIADEIRNMLGGMQPEAKLPTVRALMQQFNVSQATIDRSLAKLHDEGMIVHRPGNGYYRALPDMQQKKRQILFCFCYRKQHMNNPLYGAMLAEFIHRAADFNYNVTVMSYDETGTVEKFRDLFLDRKADCCILLGYSRQTFLYALQNMGISTIQLYPNFLPETDPTVLIDNAQVMHLIFEHLAELGHTKIAMLHGQNYDQTYMLDQEERMDAFYNEMQARGFPLSSRSMVYGGFDTETGCEAAEKLLSLAKELRPTAIIANDYNAAGVYHAAAKAGLRIPEDLSVTGIDNLPGCLCLSPLLTSVDIDWMDAVDSVIKLIESPLGEGQGHICRIPVKLVVRASTAKCP